MKKALICPIHNRERIRYPDKTRKDGRLLCPECKRETQKRADQKRTGTTHRKSIRMQSYYRTKDTSSTNSHASLVKRRYGLTSEDLDHMWKLQNGRCAICGDLPSISSKNRFGFVIDHNHVTGQVRGLLCQRCNIVLGRVQDNPDILGAMITYLMKN